MSQLASHKERYAAGEKGPQVGTWREIGQPKPPHQGAYPQGQESRFSSPQAAFDAAKDHQREPIPTYPQGLDEPDFDMSNGAIRED
jgi:hypothetical protein